MKPTQYKPHFQEGLVTRLRPQQKDSERFALFVADRFVMEVHCELLAAFGVQEGQVLSTAAQQALYRAEQERQARDVALHYLKHRPRTAQEIRRRLERAGFDASSIQGVVAWLQEHGYLNDEAYAREYARNRLQHRGYGPRRLRAELQKRGISPDIIETALAEALRAVSPIAVARHVGQKHWARLLQSEPDVRKRRRKLLNYLQRRGFTLEVAYAVLRELA